MTREEAEILLDKYLNAERDYSILNKAKYDVLLITEDPELLAAETKRALTEATNRRRMILNELAPQLPAVPEKRSWKQWLHSFL